VPGAPAAQRRTPTGRASAGDVRFGLLLLVLMTAYVLSAFIRGSWVGGLQILLFVWVTAIAVHSGDVKRGISRLAISAAIGGSAIAITLALTHSTGAVSGVGFIWGAIMLLFAVVLIIRRVIEQPDVSLQSIFGAVSAYMILGLMFAAVYAAVYRFSGTFFVQSEHDDLKTFQYFSFTTLTTLGYGDYTAAQSGGQAVAVMEALLGQMFLATLVARLVSAFRPVSRRPAAGPGHQASFGHSASPGYAAGSRHPAGPAHLGGTSHAAGPGFATGPEYPGGPGYPGAPGHLAGPDGPANPGHGASSGHPVGTARPPGSGQQASLGQPDGPPPPRLTPRARARQARRSRLRPGH
jgi:Ion channel